jgi:hypothetical protein
VETKEKRMTAQEKSYQLLCIAIEIKPPEKYGEGEGVQKFTPEVYILI